MLYKLNDDEETNHIKPLPFYNFSDIGKKEKDLENLIAENLLTVLFEESPLMPIHQQRSWQSEADLYALNRVGDLVIFELKRASVGASAVSQIMSYAQDSGQWTFKQLAKKFASFSNYQKDDPEKYLIEEHREAFQLDRTLKPNEFNLEQHLFVIGAASDDKLSRTVKYWANSGISIDFIPYRLYEINNNYYFEFFTKPFDKHVNPASSKGVLFDTNRRYSEDYVWHMLSNNRISAFGDLKHIVDYLQKGDYVFYSHKGCGIIAAGKVRSSTKKASERENYCDVEFLTSLPSKENGIQNYMPFSEVSDATGKSFYWARTIKVPYLSMKESKVLLEELKKYTNK